MFERSSFAGVDNGDDFAENIVDAHTETIPAVFSSAVSQELE